MMLNIYVLCTIWPTAQHAVGGIFITCTQIWNGLNLDGAWRTDHITSKHAAQAVPGGAGNVTVCSDGIIGKNDVPGMDVRYVYKTITQTILQVLVHHFQAGRNMPLWNRQRPMINDYMSVSPSNECGMPRTTTLETWEEGSRRYTSIKCYPGGRNSDLIRSISEIQSRMWHHCVPYTKCHHMNLA